MTQTLCELYELLGIKSICTSVYHLQMDGLVVWFTQMLKNIVRKLIHSDALNWDKWIERLLFAVREVTQASTGFSSFRLLYGRKPHSA